MKKALLIALSLILVGGIIFVIVMTSLNWEFTRLISDDYTTSTYTVEEQYSGIKITANTANITFAPSTDGKTTVTSYANEDIICNVTVSDGTLVIEMNDTCKWYEKLISGGADLTVSIPAGDYAALKIDISTGDAVVPADFSFASIDIDTTTGDVECMASASGNINIEATTGDVTLNGITAQNLSIDISTGNVNINNTTVENKLKIDGTTGDVEMYSLLAGEIEIKLTTGDVTGSLKAPMIITTKVTTGDVSVPENTVGGNCSITATTGDITITYYE